MKRSLKELFQVMLDNPQAFSTGMCFWAGTLYYTGLITMQEWNSLRDYISKNRVSMFYSIEAFKRRKMDYWFPRGEIKHRIKWIKKQIKKL